MTPARACTGQVRRHPDGIGTSLTRVERKLEEVVARADRLVALTAETARGAERLRATREASAHAIRRTDETLARIEHRLGIAQ